MNQLPNEINIEIFLYISQRQRNLCLKIVCKKWNGILKDPLFYFTIQLNTIKQWNPFSSFATTTKINNKDNDGDGDDDIPLGYYVRQIIFKKDIKHFYSYDFLNHLQLACPFVTQLINFPFINDFSSSSSSSSYPSTNYWYHLTHLPLEYTHITNWQQHNEKIKSIKVYFYNPLFNHDNDINSYENKRLRIKLLERQRRQKLARKNDFWKVIHTNHTEYLWHSTTTIIPSLSPSCSSSSVFSSFMNLSYIDINFDLYFFSSIPTSVNNQFDNNINYQQQQQQQQQHNNIINESTLISLFNSCPHLTTLKLRYLNFNISNHHQHEDINKITSLFQLLKSLQHLYLDHCTFLNPQCYVFFTPPSPPTPSSSTCNYSSLSPLLKTLDLYHMIWPSFININHLPTVIQYKNSIHHMITSFPLLSRLNIDFQLNNNNSNSNNGGYDNNIDSFELNRILLPNLELLEWLTNHPKQLSYFGYQYDLLVLSDNHHNYYYLNHLTTLHIKNISTSLLSLLNQSSSSILLNESSPPSSSILSTSIKTLILSGDKQSSNSICYIYYWLNAFPNLKSFKISKMKIIIKANNHSVYYHDLYYPYHNSISPYYSAYQINHHLVNHHHHYENHHKTHYNLRELILKKSKIELENNNNSHINMNGFEILLKRCLNLNKIEFSRLKFGIDSLWYQQGNYKSMIPFLINASHLKLDYLKIMDITFYPSSTLPSSSKSSSFSLLPSSFMMNHEHSFYHQHWDNILKHYKVLYTIEEIGSTKDIITYSNNDDDNNYNNNNNSGFTINFHLECQYVDQLDFY